MKRYLIGSVLMVLMGTITHAAGPGPKASAEKKVQDAQLVMIDFFDLLFKHADRPSFHEWFDIFDENFQNPGAEVDYATVYDIKDQRAALVDPRLVIFLNAVYHDYETLKVPNKGPLLELLRDNIEILANLFGTTPLDAPGKQNLDQTTKGLIKEIAKKASGSLLTEQLTQLSQTRRAIAPAKKPTQQEQKRRTQPQPERKAAEDVIAPQQALLASIRNGFLTALDRGDESDMQQAIETLKDNRSSMPDIKEDVDDRLLELNEMLAEWKKAKESERKRRTEEKPAAPKRPAPKIPAPKKPTTPTAGPGSGQQEQEFQRLAEERKRRASHILEPETTAWKGPGARQRQSVAEEKENSPEKQMQRMQENLKPLRQALAEKKFDVIKLLMSDWLQELGEYNKIPLLQKKQIIKGIYDDVKKALTTAQLQQLKTALHGLYEQWEPK